MHHSPHGIFDEHHGGCLKVQLCSQWFEKPNMKHETRYGILLLFYVLFFPLHQISSSSAFS